jgi:RNA polymerase sigma-70 factor (TIGR02960 family)
VTTTDVIALARAGDEDAFRRLVAPYRREVELHCYRILGSAHDAEDALQETVLAAWRGVGGFEGRASIRTWLYRVATSCCLKALRSRKRRPTTTRLMPAPDLPEPTQLGEVPWLEPFPDALLEGLADSAAGPEARYETREAVSLAFVTALQLLPPRQRAVLILRDVLGFHAKEVAQILGTTDESVASALKRARSTLQRHVPAGERQPPPPRSAIERELVEQFTRAFEAGDVDGIVALLTDDVRLTMPPVALEWQGREVAVRFLTATIARQRRGRRLVPARANGQPAFGIYVRVPHDSAMHAAGLLVLSLAGHRISAMTGFDSGVLRQFGLPHAVPDRGPRSWPRPPSDRDG